MSKYESLIKLSNFSLSALILRKPLSRTKIHTGFIAGGIKRGFKARLILTINNLKRSHLNVIS